MTDPPPDPTLPPPEPTEPPLVDPVDEPPLLLEEDIPAVRRAAPPPAAPPHIGFWVTLGVVGVFTAAALAVGGEAQAFALSGLQSLPLIGLALLAYVGRRSPVGRVLTALYWVGLIGLTAAVVLIMTGLAELDPTTFPAKPRAPGLRPRPPQLLPGGLRALGLCTLGVLPGVLAGALGFVPAVRRWAARLIPIDPTSFVHATALATVVGMTWIMFVPLVVLGEPPALLMVAHFQGTDLAKTFASDSNLRSTFYGLVWLVPGAVVAVGYPLARPLPAALARLGLVVPRWWQVALALGVAVAMVPLMIGFEAGVTWLWTRLGWPTTNEKEFNELMKFALNWQGALVIGLVAGVGEEVAIRGVLQPRLGILLSTLLFASLHALQYNFDAVLSVFVIGLILAVVRRYTNTTTTAIIHGTYDCILILIAAYGEQLQRWLQQ
jgi:membrane protease YdiL (CAAX protease family)